jgi:hypothetical protein
LCSEEEKAVNCIDHGTFCPIVMPKDEIAKSTVIDEISGKSIIEENLKVKCMMRLEKQDTSKTTTSLFKYLNLHR